MLQVSYIIINTIQSGIPAQDADNQLLGVQGVQLVLGGPGGPIIPAVPGGQVAQLQYSAQKRC